MKHACDRYTIHYISELKQTIKAQLAGLPMHVASTNTRVCLMHMHGFYIGSTPKVCLL